MAACSLLVVLRLQVSQQLLASVLSDRREVEIWVRLGLWPRFERAQSLKTIMSLTCTLQSTISQKIIIKIIKYSVKIQPRRPLESSSNATSSLSCLSIITAQK